MATAVIMPKAGMSMESGTIVRWLKKVGEEVRVGEPLLEITTDKVDMEVEAEVSRETRSASSTTAGEQIAVTEPIGYIGSSDEMGKSDQDLGKTAGAGRTRRRLCRARRCAAAMQATGMGQAGNEPAAARVASTPAARRRAAESASIWPCARADGPPRRGEGCGTLAAGAEQPRVRGVLAGAPARRTGGD